MITRSNTLTRLGLVALAAGSLSLVGALSAAQKTNPNGVPDSTSDNPHLSKAVQPAAADKVKLDAKDKDFISKAAAGGMLEVEMGQMAEKQGKGDEVKKIGSMMVADHSKANKELMAIAKKKGIEVGKPTSSGSFGNDKQYLMQMVSDHQQDAKLFEQEAKNGKDVDLKAFAAKTLPVIQHHLAMVKAANAKEK